LERVEEKEEERSNEGALRWQSSEGRKEGSFIKEIMPKNKVDL
jgi:hypothetical protein